MALNFKIEYYCLLNSLLLWNFLIKMFNSYLENNNIFKK